MHKLYKNIPFIIGVFVILVGLCVVTPVMLRENDGLLVYTTDDPYIHMALAKNIATHGVFGVTRYAFSSCSSSPLWTFLLAFFYRIFGISEWPPGILAALFAVAALYSTQTLARRLGVSTQLQTLTVLSVLYFTPLIPVITTGMEHTMHVFFTITFFATVIEYIQAPKHSTLVMVCVVGALAVAARYESLFYIAPLALVLTRLKQWRSAIIIFLTSMIPVLVFGAFFLWHGAFFFPTTLLLKGHFPKFQDLNTILSTIGFFAIRLILQNSHLFIICILLLLGVAKSQLHHTFRLITMAFVLSILLNLQFGGINEFYRYEAYLVAVALPLIAGLHLGKINSEPMKTPISSTPSNPYETKGLTKAAMLGFAFLILWPLHQRALESLEAILPASSHIYRQQFQMANFVKQMYPPGVSIALNDLGAISFYNDARILDLVGLGSLDVARAKQRKDFNTGFIKQLLVSNKVDFIMVYPQWFMGEWALPEDTARIADWITSNNFWDETVSFYAFTKENQKTLYDRLKQYQSHLPDSVQVNYFYTDSDPSIDEISPTTMPLHRL